VRHRQEEQLAVGSLHWQRVHPKAAADAERGMRLYHALGIAGRPRGVDDGGDAAAAHLLAQLGQGLRGGQAVCAATITELAQRHDPLVDLGIALGVTVPQDDLLYVGDLGANRQQLLELLFVFNEDEACLAVLEDVSDRLFIFPSPNDGNFSVSYYNTGGVSTQRRIRVMDAKGALVFDKVFPVSGPYTIIPVNLTQASRGLYYVVVGDAAGKKLAEGKMHVR